MTQYIDKAALVAEIERRMKLREDSYKRYNTLSDFIAWEELEYFKDDFLPTLEVKEVDLEDEVDKDDYWNLFRGGTKLNIDSTTELNFDETTKFNLYDYIKMKEEEKTNSSKFYKRIFKNIPTVSMKIFSWWNRNKRKENNL